MESLRVSGVWPGAGILHRSRARPTSAAKRRIVYAGSYGLMTAIALRYWFPAPLLFIAAAFVCFAAAVATSART